MLKVKGLRLADGLTEEEKMAPGNATVTFAADLEANGTCKFDHDGANIVATIVAAGNNKEDDPVDVDPANITVKVEKVLKRTVAVEEGDTSIDTKLGAAVTSAKMDGEDVPTAKLADGVITIDAAAKDKLVELELKVDAAEGTAEAPTIAAGKLLKLDPGEFRVSLIAMAEHMPCQKPSKVRFCVYNGQWPVTGKDSPLHM